MNDEFEISKTIITGSQGGREVEYNLYSVRLSTDLNGLTLDEIVRLHSFLTEYIKKEQNNENR